MTLEYIAAIIESVYYNGRVLANDKKIDIDDFMQMSRAANGDIMRAMWYEESQAGNANLYFSGALVTERFKIKKKGRFRIFEFEDGGAVKLPYAMGIMRVAPAMFESDDCEGCEEHYDLGDFYSRGEPGMEYSFGSDDMLSDLGEALYIPIGNTCRLLGFAEAKFAEADYIKNDENLDVPESAAWRIINTVLGPVLKVDGFPVDVNDDNNPNVVSIKKQIADPQGL